MEWKDSTGYARGDKERIPTTFSAQAGPIRLVVTLGHLYYPDRWVGHAYPIFDTKPLNANTMEQAQEEVLAMARKWLADACSGIA